MLVSSLFSTLFGRTVHGSVYVSQTFNFKRPVHVGKSKSSFMTDCDREIADAAESINSAYLLQLSSV